jgi:hypothetical protein
VYIVVCSANSRVSVSKSDVTLRPQEALVLTSASEV